MMDGVGMSFLRGVMVCGVLGVGTLLAQAPLEGAKVDDIDRSVDACQNFDGFANGTWRKDHPMPAVQTTWARRNVAQDETLGKLKTLLESSAKTTAANGSAAKGSTDQLIGDFYGACMNEAQINGLGLKPLEPVLAKIDAVKDRKGLTAEIVELQRYGIAVPVRVSASQDPHSPTDVIAELEVNGMGLPDRDYYLRDEPRFKGIREKYVAHMEKMFTLAGYDAATSQQAAAAVLKLETKLATAKLTKVQMRDTKETDHPTSFAELQAMTPRFDWVSAYRTLGVPQGKLNVDEPKLVKVFDAELEATPLAEWKSYLKWHVLRKESAALPVVFGNETFAFFGTTMTGAKEQRPRDQRCVRQTDTQLGEALGKKYVEAYFPPEAKARAREMAVNIVDQLKLSIQNNDWMTADTKTKALEKVGALNIKVGYPDKWKTYASVEVSRGEFLKDAMATDAFKVRDDLAQIGKPLDRGRWDMTPPTLNAYYNPQMNEIVVPAGYLQPPGFNLKGIDAVNYGAIGVTIGHEISHGVDDQGARYDAKGALTDWWSPESYKQFEAKTGCTAEQYDKYFVDPGVHLNGRFVLGEALGDLGGVNLAFRAYKKSREGKGPEPTVDGFTPEQQFFLAEAQWRGALARPEYARMAAQVDPHPAGKYRVIGPLSNMPEFEKAFSCKKGDAMVRTEAERCVLW
ncbi:M13 family metallopeptidase [soil metagenome]